MRLGLAVVLAAFCASLGFPASSSANAYGDNYVYTNDCSCTLHGTHSDIHLPDVDGTWIMTLNNFGIERVSAEFSNGVGAGLIQAGANISNHRTGDDCDYDSAGEVEAFIEHKAYPSGSYLCDTYGTGLTGNHTFRVNRTDDCSTCWSGWVSGIRKPKVDVGFANATYVTAGGEVAVASPSAIVVKGTFGQVAADIPWERTAAIFPTTPTWTSIGSGAHCEADGVWRVQAAPSPFQSQYLPSNPGCVP